nr:MAG TPA: DNA polymerase III subunit alpha [Caudoviricetes sp.]
MRRSNYLVLDCETGGLDPEANPITQFAAVVLDHGTLKEVDRWETYVRPYNGLKIDREAIERTMVNMSAVNAGLKLDEFIESLMAFMSQNLAEGSAKAQRRLVGVGHNVLFDVGMLEAAFGYSTFAKKNNLFQFIQDQTLDTMYFSKMILGLTGNEKMTLGATCEHCGITLTDAHGAMNDVEATADLFRWCVKKLRSKGGAAPAAEKKTRPRGSKFFEFQCAKH